MSGDEGLKSSSSEAFMRLVSVAIVKRAGAVVVVVSIAMGAVAMGTMVPPMAIIAGLWVTVVTSSVAVSGAVSQGRVLSRNPSMISCGIRGKPDSLATS